MSASKRPKARTQKPPRRAGRRRSARQRHEGDLLTAQQHAFVDQYLVDLNGTQAAIRAGYSAHTAQEQASRLLSNVNIEAAIRDAMTARAERTEITVDRTLLEYGRLAFSDMRDFVEWGPHGIRLKPSSGLTTDQARAVAQVTETFGPAGRKLTIKLHEKKGALDSVAKHLGMFRDEEGLTLKHVDALLDGVVALLEKHLPRERVRDAVVELMRIGRERFQRASRELDAPAA